MITVISKMDFGGKKLGIAYQHVALKCLLHLEWCISHFIDLPLPDTNNHFKNKNPCHLECFLKILHFDIKIF